MGFFDVHCSLSGVALRDHTALLLLAAAPGRSFEPVAPAVFGSYDRLGCIDRIITTACSDAMNELLSAAALSETPRDASLAARLSTLSRGVSEDLWATLGEHRLSYALVDGRVYTAARMVVESDDDNVDAMADRPWQDLMREAFGAHPVARHLADALAAKERDENAWLGLGYELADLHFVRRFLRETAGSIGPIDVEDSEQLHRTRRTVWLPRSRRCRAAALREVADTRRGDSDERQGVARQQSVAAL